jgi:multicomponent Na+:H+ antiporter subunit C
VRILGLYNYWVFIFLMMVGFYILISRSNLVQKVLGLSVFQTAVFIFYISMGSILGAEPPILVDGVEGILYANPLPHVLILTAIVVGVSTTAVALALVVRIREAYDTIEGDEIAALDSLDEE